MDTLRVQNACLCKSMITKKTASRLEKKEQFQQLPLDATKRLKRLRENVLRHKAKRINERNVDTSAKGNLRQTEKKNLRDDLNTVRSSTASSEYINSQ